MYEARLEINSTLEQLKAMDSLFQGAKCDLEFERGKSVVQSPSRCYPVSLLHIRLDILPTEFYALLTLDIGHLRAPVKHNDARMYLNL